MKYLTNVMSLYCYALYKKGSQSIVIHICWSAQKKCTSFGVSLMCNAALNTVPLKAIAPQVQRVSNAVPPNLNLPKCNAPQTQGPSNAMPLK